MDNTSTGTIEVLGNLYIQGGNIQNTDPGGGGSITVWGDVECGWELNNHGNFGSFGDIHVNYLENAGPGSVGASGLRVDVCRELGRWDDLCLGQAGDQRRPSYGCTGACHHIKHIKHNKFKEENLNAG